jgi:general nucleoside transport system permease protein
MRRLLQPILAVVVGLALGLSFTWFAGENPLHVARILWKSAFGSSYDMGMTLFYTTPLIFTGLSVAVAFQAGLFNIGAEGQLTLGALAAGVTGVLWPNLPVAALFAGLAAFLAGTVWGAIPGWLRAKRGSHEVINTIMLNFIAAGIASYVTLYLFKNPTTQNPETRPVGTGYLIHQFGVFGGAPVSTALLLAVVAAVLVWVFLWRTVVGYELRAVGQNDAAARAAGIDAGRIRILAMCLAGGLAGLVGVGEVLGNAGKFRLGFSPQYGFIGIAVALLGRNRPGGVVAAALLFGALHKGTADLDLETEHVTREVSLILQALIILSVSAEGLWSWMKRRGES